MLHKCCLSQSLTFYPIFVIAVFAFIAITSPVLAQSLERQRQQIAADIANDQNELQRWRDDLAWCMRGLNQGRPHCLPKADALNDGGSCASCVEEMQGWVEGIEKNIGLLTQQLINIDQRTARQRKGPDSNEGKSFGSYGPSSTCRGGTLGQDC